MTLFAWMLLLTASTRGELADEDCQIPAGEWRYVEVQLHQEPASVSASYEVRSGAGRVRLALMRREDLERMRDDLPHGHLAETPLGKSGQLTDAFRRRGDYAVVLDNRGGTLPVTVHLRVWLDFGGRAGPEVTELAPERQFVVVAASLAVFLGIVAYSSRRLWRAVKDVKKI
jgi:hypothetical protein